MAARPGARRRYRQVVVVTRPTDCERLARRHATVAQARFVLDRSGVDFAPIQAAHDRYHRALDAVRAAIPAGVKQQTVDRELVDRMQFDAADLVVTVGQDGLVANTAKYVAGQPIMAVNPDPDRFDGVLLPFTVATFVRALPRVLRGEATTRRVTLAEARLSDTQRLLGFNDLFVGVDWHGSARYRIAHGDSVETQSSSGVIVSTGAGSSGWLRSVYAGAAGVVEALGGRVEAPPDGGRFAWDADRLVYAVREPFPSRTTGTGLVHGVIERDRPLTITSEMSDDGVIFSDGQPGDRLEFGAGVTATIGLAAERAVLVTG